MKRSTHHLLAAVLSGLFGLFLTYHSLTSSDFPRGLYEPPMTTNAAVWDSFAALNQNRVWHYGLGGYLTLASYMNLIHYHGMKAVLRLEHGPYQPADCTFFLSNYSYSQHDQFEAEQDYQDSYTQFFTFDNPEYYYFFWHGSSSSSNIGALDPTQPSGGASWKCTKATDNAGYMLYGPRETILGIESYGGYGSQTAWPDFSDSIRGFRTIVCAIANLNQLASQDCTVFRLDVLRWNAQDDTSFYFHGHDFTANEWTELNADYAILDTVKGEFRTMYKMYWYDNCDFWVDWIKYMDMKRGYYLFYNAYLQDSILTRMAAQCQGIENDRNNWPANIAGWGQSDEPKRSSFRAHGVVNDLARASLTKPPLTPLKQDYYQRRPDLFVQVGRPPLVDTDPYVFKGDSSYGLPGSQQELDTLAKHLEDAYQACQIDQDSSIEMHFTGQVFAKWNSASSQYTSRHPTAAEIRVETGMALAHGAKGISFFTYRSSYNSTTGDSVLGLVNLQGEHPAGTSYDDKWQAVQDVFTQLDSIGDTLLLLDRRAAFCANEGGFLSPIDNVHFEEEESQDSAWIEVGQFYGPGNTDYLIIVNRRTDALAELVRGRGP